MRNMRQWQENASSSVAIFRLENDVFFRPVSKLLRHFFSMTTTDNNQDPLSRHEPLDAFECVFQHRVATKNRTELFDPAPPTQSGEESSYSCSFSRGQNNTPELSYFWLLTHCFSFFSDANVKLAQTGKQR